MSDAPGQGKSTRYLATLLPANVREGEKRSFGAQRSFRRGGGGRAVCGTMGPRGDMGVEWAKPNTVWSFISDHEPASGALCDKSARMAIRDDYGESWVTGIQKPSYYLHSLFMYPIVIPK